MLIILVLFSLIFGIGIGTIITVFRCGKKLDSITRERDKYRRYAEISDRMIMSEYKDGTLSTYISVHHIKKVAVYGMGSMGHSLCEILKKHGLDIVYVMDQEDGALYQECPICTFEDDLPEVDIVIITPVHALDSIRKSFENKGVYNAMSIEEII